MIIVFTTAQTFQQFQMDSKEMYQYIEDIYGDADRTDYWYAQILTMKEGGTLPMWGYKLYRVKGVL